MPLHFAAPCAAAAAWGALTDCDHDTTTVGGSRDDDGEEKKYNDNGVENNNEQEEEEEDLPSPQPHARRRRRFSDATVSSPPLHEENNNWLLGIPYQNYSTSTYNDDVVVGSTALSFSEQQGATAHHHHHQQQQQPPAVANSIRMIPSFQQQRPSTSNPKRYVRKSSSVALNRASSTVPRGESTSSTISGFVNGDFASGKIRDIPVDGCFVMAFDPTHSLLAVGTCRSVEFYETTNFSLAYRFFVHSGGGGSEQQHQVSALQWLDTTTTENTTGKRNNNLLLAMGDLGGNALLLHIEEEILEQYGPTILHQFTVQDQIRTMDLKCIITNSVIVMAVGDKSGQVTLSCYDSSDNMQETSRQVVRHFESDKVLSLVIQPQQRLIAMSTMAGDVFVYPLLLDEDFHHQSMIQLHHFHDPVFHHQRRGAVRSVVFSPAGKFLALGGYDKTLVLVDTKLWAATRELSLDGTINVISFDPLDRYLAVGTRDKSFVLFDTSTFVPIKTFHTPGWVTSISWGARTAYQDFVAVRSQRTCISLLDLTPIGTTSFDFEDDMMEDGAGTGDECTLSWSQNGRYCARVIDTSLCISDSNDAFRDAARFPLGGTIKGVAFCPAPGKEDLLATATLDGYVRVLRIQEGPLGFSIEVVKSMFVEENLWVVNWSPDGSILAAGGRGKILHIFSTDTYEPIMEPIYLEGRVWGMDFSNSSSAGASGLDENIESSKSVYNSQLAVASGSDVAIIFNPKWQPCLQIHRPRTARCLKYHPTLPILAIGDGSGLVAIIDYENEETIREFRAGSRVNTVDFSPTGDFLVVGTDECLFTLYETTDYKAVQAIPVQGLGMVASFCPNGHFLAVGTSEGIYSIVRLGCLLGIDLVPLNLEGGVEKLPAWALNEVLYRSGDGPSFIQRHMRRGEQDNLQRVAKILQQHPEAIYAFDRRANEGAFDTAMLLRKPNLLKLAVQALVDGNLGLNSDSILTSDIPQKALTTLEEMIEHYDPQLVVDILRDMAFVKVPFSGPMVVEAKDVQERGSDSTMSPWSSKRKTPSIFTDREEPAKGTFMRTPAVLPLPGLGRMQFLSSLLLRAPPTAFDNNAMATVLRILWSKIRIYYIIDLVLYMLLYIFWVMLVDAKFSDDSDANDGAFKMVAAVICFSLNTLFAAKELIQSDYGRRPGYFSSKWNAIDILSILCLWWYIVTTCFASSLEDGSEPLAVVTSLLVTLKLIAYLRGISETGWLVSVLSHNLHDVRGFLLILFAILVGFTTAFRILFGRIDGSCALEFDEEEQIMQVCDDSPFGSYRRAFISSFQMIILGEYEGNMLYESDYSALAIIIFVLAVTCVLIVALNALISVLADSYARVQENAAANRRKERAELIVEYMSILPASKRRQIEKETMYFHALLEADADGDLLLTKEDWQGGLNALRREMEEHMNETSEQNRKALEQLQLDMEAEMTSFRKEVVSLLDDLATDVRDIRRLQSHDGITLNGKNVAKAVKAVKSIGRRGQKAVFGQRK